MKEYHYILRADSIQGILAGQQKLLTSEMAGAETVFKRYFLSEASSQRALLPDEDGAVSYIQQPPLDGSSVAVWMYLVRGADVIRTRGVTLVKDGPAEHLFTAGLTGEGTDSEEQSREILEKYESYLSGEGLSITDNCVRTWFYCRDIDDRYAGLVKARRENFHKVGLTPGTHFLASTGIAGVSPVPGAFVQMDAWAIKGSFSQQYLYGASHLSPTYDYGVTFERGVKVTLQDKSCTIISGTASIDNKGRVLHVGDVMKQAYRMLENVEVLLCEAGSGWSSVKHIFVYLRNASDYETVAPLFAERFPEIPYIITLAPVCRPDWLIEMECLAVD